MSAPYREEALPWAARGFRDPGRRGARGRRPGDIGDFSAFIRPAVIRTVFPSPVSPMSPPRHSPMSPLHPHPRRDPGSPRSRFSSPTCTRTRYDRFGAISRRATRSPRTSPTSSRGVPRAPRRSTPCTSTTAARWRSARNRFGTCSRGTPSRTGASSPPRFPAGPPNARGGPKRRRWRRARARSSRRRTRTGTNSWEMPRRGAGARRNRTRISRDSWTTPCASSRPGTGADRRRGSRRRPPRRPPRANPSPRLSANTPSPSPPRGTIISACATRSGGWTTRSGPEAPPSPTLRGATSRARRRLPRGQGRPGGVRGADGRRGDQPVPKLLEPHLQL